MRDLYVPGADCEAGTGQARRHRQGGQTLVVVAVMLVVLIGFLGLVIDGGNVYAQRRQMQNAADAAALAGARALALGGDAEVQGTADNYAQDNGATACTVVTTSTTVRAIVTKTVETYFIRVLGITGVPVGADATAEIRPLTKTSCPVMPLTVENLSEFAEYEAGQEFTVWDANPGHEDKCEQQATGSYFIPPSQHGWLSLDPDEDCNAGASDVSCWECVENKKDCPRRTIAVGDWIPARPGLVDRTVQDMGCNKGKTVLIPLYDQMCDCKAQEPEPTPTPKKTPEATPTPGPTPVPPCSGYEGVPCDGGCGPYYHIIAFASVKVKAIVQGSGASGCKLFKVYWQDLLTSPECAEGGEEEPTNTWTVHLIE